MSLGADWLDAPATLDALVTAELQESVASMLGQPGQDRAACEAAIKKRVDAVRTMAGADPQEARYRVRGRREGSIATVTGSLK